MSPDHNRSWRTASQGTLTLGTAIAVACSQQTVIDPVTEEVELVDIAVLPRVADHTPNESQQFQTLGVAQAGTTVPTTVCWDAEGGTIDRQGVFVAASESRNGIVMRGCTAGNDAAQDHTAHGDGAYPSDE